MVDICQSLADQSQPHKDCLGFTLDDKMLFWGTSPVDRQAPVEIDRNCPTLEDLLSQNSSSPGRAIALSQRECLPLAVVFASSLLQLHSTPWLPDSWCTESIYFSRMIDIQNPAKLQRPVCVQHPYVKSKLGRSPPLYHPQVKMGVHPYLLPLGIILLELSERKSFSHWVNTRYPDLPDNLTDKAKAAWEWYEEEASGNMSPQYATAVKNCLNSSYMGPFTPQKMTLMEEGFRDAVYREVVRRLEIAYIEFTKPIDGTMLQQLG